MNWSFLRRRAYRIGKFNLWLTRDHALPRYQDRFRTYDRFLPVLAQQLTKPATVVDVGANVGDTVAAMASANPDLHFLAVEPDPVYSALLKENVARMRSIEPDLSVDILEALIADDLSIVGLEGSRGSRHAVVSSETGKSASFATSSLDNLLLPHAPQRVALIKTDTDGFDWSVIDSGQEFFVKYQPLLYFECEVETDSERIEKYSRTFDMLVRNGYVEFHVFDNYGGYFGRLDGPKFLTDLLTYIAAQNAGRMHRTIYYLDILAAAQSHSREATNAVDAFMREYLT
jgi:FkbM family methyltransferase